MKRAFSHQLPAMREIEMAHLPEKDPGLWAALIGWMIARQPGLYATGLWKLPVLLDRQYAIGSGTPRFDGYGRIRREGRRDGDKA